MNTVDEISREIQNLLESDETALGRVYCAYQEFGEDKTQRRISENSGIPEGTVAMEFQIIKQLMQNGDLPSTTTQCRTIADEIKRFKNRSTLEISELALLRIDGLIENLLIKSEDSKLVAKERQKNIQTNETFNRKPGIYVYTYPQYRMHPAVEATDDTPERYHLKVGKTIRDSKRRVKEQTTGMPEDPIPILLIIGKDGENFSIESELIDQLEGRIHEHLEIVGHARNRKKGGGNEWFLSNKETIISIAELMGLKYEDPDHQTQTSD